MTAQQLRALAGPEKERTFPLSRVSTLIVGRCPDVAISLRDPAVSRTHCRIVPRDSGWLVEDLESPGGLRVNGRRGRQMTLDLGDWLQVGRSILLAESSNRGNTASPGRSSDGEVVPSELLWQCHAAGDSQAAGRIFDRYAERLIALARSRMSERLGRRIDPEDIVQSACRSFFRREWFHDPAEAAPGRLWALLAGITVKKVLKQAEAHGAKKRSIASESTGDQCGQIADSMHSCIDREPTPDEAAALLDELDRVTRNLTESEREIWSLQVDGLEQSAIALRLGCSTRTVRRVIDRIRSELERRLLGDAH